MSITPPTRTTASGRAYPGSFYEDPYKNELQHALEQVSKAAARYGFKSIFDAALNLAEHQEAASKHQLTEFAEDGGLSRLIKAACRKDIQTSIKLAEALRDLKSALCETAAPVYLEEWRGWIAQKGIRRLLKEFSLEYVQSFNVEPLYAGWRRVAPLLCSLFEGMAQGKASKGWPMPHPDPSNVHLSTNDKRLKEYRRHCRHIVMALSIMGALSSRQINLVQGIIAYFMYSCRVPKRVITILHKWGIAVAYSSVRQAVQAMGNSLSILREAECLGKSLRNELKQLGSRDIAFQVVFDNCTAQASVRDKRLHNKSDFLNYTVGFVLEPAIPCSMFDRSHIDYGKVQSLKFVDFIPPEEDTDAFRSIFQHFIANAVGRYCAKRHVRLPKLDFPMPSVKCISLKTQPKVHVLPTYDLDESRMDDMIEILYRIGNDVGLKESHIQNNVVAYGGDYFTAITER